MTNLIRKYFENWQTLMIIAGKIRMKVLEPGTSEKQALCFDTHSAQAIGTILEIIE